jgi:hypothetical protein
MAKMRISEPDERGRPKKESLPWEGLGVAVGERLDALQTLLYDRALARQKAKEVHVYSCEENIPSRTHNPACPME